MRPKNWAERMEEDPEETSDFNEDLTFPDNDEANNTFKVCDKTEFSGRMLYPAPTIRPWDTDLQQTGWPPTGIFN